MVSIFLKNTALSDLFEMLKIIKITELHNIPGKNNRDTESNNSENKSFNSVEHENVDCAIDKKNSHVNEKQTKYDPFLVTWNGPNDPDYPMNWSTSRKILVIVQIMLLTCVNYMGSSIYAPGEDGIREEFKVGHVTATLNVSLYILGYGIGPLLFSTLSELSTIGRQPIYIITFIMFFLFNIDIATVHSIGGMIVMRFITGILCSLQLATGGATIGDVMPPEMINLFLGIWSVGVMVAPITGPLLGAAMVVARG
ncbi:hypothetical protein C6P45_001564 [Maudiozyma exigua]|uniref:Major facilitator superfamily (MFS) profile domain-containing protein n=1 Tax=Maudiozyma exigua TaxID=34358 RepID=A0A9P6W2P7_MAUEX|nr:hypothetical protein C6P45_001564 [Kazachstania exigua]